MVVAVAGAGVPARAAARRGPGVGGRQLLRVRETDQPDQGCCY